MATISGRAVTPAFPARRSIGGIRSGSLLVAEGMVGGHHSKLAIIDPAHQLLSVPGSSDAP